MHFNNLAMLPLILAAVTVAAPSDPEVRDVSSEVSTHMRGRETSQVLRSLTLYLQRLYPREVLNGEGSVSWLEEEL